MTRWMEVDDVQRRYFMDADGTPTVSTKWILRHVPAHRFARGVVRFAPDEVEAFIASRGPTLTGRHATGRAA